MRFNFLIAGLKAAYAAITGQDASEAVSAKIDAFAASEEAALNGRQSGFLNSLLSTPTCDVTATTTPGVTSAPASSPAPSAILSLGSFRTGMSVHCNGDLWKGHGQVLSVDSQKVHVRAGNGKKIGYDATDIASGKLQIAA